MKKTAKQQRRAKLFAWVCNQHAGLDAQQMAEALTCEALPHDQTPLRFQEAVTEFRHLGSDARVAACRAHLENRS